MLALATPSDGQPTASRHSSASPSQAYSESFPALTFPGILSLLPSPWLSPAASFPLPAFPAPLIPKALSLPTTAATTAL